MGEWYCDALQAALLLLLQGVTEARESQMSVELQALPTPCRLGGRSLLTSLHLVHGALRASGAM